MGKLYARVANVVESPYSGVIYPYLSTYIHVSGVSKIGEFLNFYTQINRNTVQGFGRDVVGEEVLGEGLFHVFYVVDNGVLQPLVKKVTMKPFEKKYPFLTIDRQNYIIKKNGKYFWYLVDVNYKDLVFLLYLLKNGCTGFRIESAEKDGFTVICRGDEFEFRVQREWDIYCPVCGNIKKFTVDCFWGDDMLVCGMEHYEDMNALYVETDDVSFYRPLKNKSLVFAAARIVGKDVRKRMNFGKVTITFTTVGLFEQVYPVFVMLGNDEKPLSEYL